ncbi:MAG: hypothetical protein WGN25_09340 [Candidatus Electrothrix sp. GW3-4]|uniref:hypothetical protein n=1 Tax=Candidatus Electrothrix sp. GW3-4 TaxID=3126740 RepID=UPI0030CB676D
MKKQGRVRQPGCGKKKMSEQHASAVAGRVDLGFRLKESCFRGRKRLEVHAVAVRS